MAVVPNPAKAGLDADRLERYDDYLEVLVENGRIPGAVYLVYQKGQLAALESYGYTDVGSRDAIRDDAIFQIMSMTKPQWGS